MNSLERTQKAIKMEKIDRIPTFPLIDIAFASSYLNRLMREVQLDPRLHANALNTCADELPVDGVYINLGLNSGQCRWLKKDTYLIDEALTLVIPENDVLSVHSRDITSLEDERIETAELFHPGMLTAFKLMREEIKKNHAVVVGITGTFSQLAFLYGIPELLMALLDQPEAVRKALEKRHPVVLRQTREICAAGARFIWIGEGIGSGSLISPEQYRSFVLPYEQSLAQEIRKGGALSLLHICGNVTSALPDIARSGVDGFDVDYPVDLREALDILLPEVAVKGNINPSLFLKDHQNELESSCWEAKAISGGRRGYIMSTGCLVPRDSVVESFHVMARICGKQSK